MSQENKLMNTKSKLNIQKSDFFTLNIHSSLLEVLEKDWWIKTENENSTAQNYCLLYTSDAADDMQCVDLGGRRIIKKRRAIAG